MVSHSSVRHSAVLPRAPCERLRGVDGRRPRNSSPASVRRTEFRHSAPVPGATGGNWAWSRCRGSADMVRRNAVRTVEEAHRRMLVDLMGRCGPDSLLVDRRPDGAELTVRSATALRRSGASAVAERDSRGDGLPGGGLEFSDFCTAYRPSLVALGGANGLVAAYVGFPDCSRAPTSGCSAGSSSRCDGARSWRRTRRQRRSARPRSAPKPSSGRLRKRLPEAEGDADPLDLLARALLALVCSGLGEHNGSQAELRALVRETVREPGRIPVSRSSWAFRGCRGHADGPVPTMRFPAPVTR